jgi:ribosomal subunit interface protein
MQQPLQVTFRDIDYSAAVEEHIISKANKLDHFFEHMTACEVVVSRVQKHQQQGKLNDVSIRLSVPGKTLSISHHPHENLYLAVKIAFDAMREQLESYRQRLQGDIKNHGERLQGEIVRLLPEDEYGFIVDDLGNEYYFNLGHLVNATFHQLHVGEHVRFMPAMGHDGQQARRVSVTKKH